MTAHDPPSFDELVDLLRVRLGDADALNDSAIHGFTELLRDLGEHIPDRGTGTRWRSSRRKGISTPHLTK